MNRRRFILQSLGTSLALPGLPSLKAATVGGNSAVQTAKGAGAGARRFVAIGNGESRVPILALSCYYSGKKSCLCGFGFHGFGRLLRNLEVLLS